MSDLSPRDRAARKPTANWGIVAIAIGLAFVVFVIRRGVTGHAVITWIVASAVGVVVFVVARASWRGRAK